METAPCPGLSAALEACVNEHLELLRAKICQRAQELASEDGVPNAETPPAISSVQCLRAINEIAPGGPVNNVITQELGFWHRFTSSVSPITLISSVLTIIFAAFGLWVVRAGASDPRAPLNGGAYLDIAKIFAGAIVGSASVAAVATTRKSTALDLAPLLTKKPKK